MQETPPLPSPDSKAALRTQLLLDVLAGKITATQAAETLDVSRRVWHEWQNRGLSSMTEAMQDRLTGRPLQPVDEEKSQLQARVRQLELQVEGLERSKRVLNLLKALPPLEPGAGSKKKP